MRLGNELDLRFTSGNAPDAERDEEGRTITQLTLSSRPPSRRDQLPGDTVSSDLPGYEDYPDDSSDDEDSDDAHSDDEQEADDEDE